MPVYLDSQGKIINPGVGIHTIDRSGYDPFHQSFLWVVENRGWYNTEWFLRARPYSFHPAIRITEDSCRFLVALDEPEEWKPEHHESIWQRFISLGWQISASIITDDFFFHKAYELTARNTFNGKRVVKRTPAFDTSSSTLPGLVVASQQWEDLFVEVSNSNFHSQATSDFEEW